MYSFNSQIDISRVNEYCGDDVSFIKIMFETFLESNLPYWDEVQSKLKAQKYDEIAKPIHTLKPSFSMIGFPEVTEQVREYEAFVKTKPSIPDLLKGAAALDVEVNRVKNILIEEISKMEAEGY